MKGSKRKRNRRRERKRLLNETIARLLLSRPRRRATLGPSTIERRACHYPFFRRQRGFPRCRNRADDRTRNFARRACEMLRDAARCVTARRACESTNGRKLIPNSDSETRDDSVTLASESHDTTTSAKRGPRPEWFVQTP